MKKQRFFLRELYYLTFLCLSCSFAMAQARPAIKVNTQKQVGSKQAISVKTIDGSYKIDWGDGNLISYTNLITTGVVRGNYIAVFGDVIQIALTQAQVDFIQELNAPNIKVLNLSDNLLSELKLPSLKFLTSISVQNNQLNEFPQVALPALTTLNLKHNKLTGFNPNDLPKLKTLILSENPLNKVDVSRCPNIKSLRIEKCSLSDLSFSAISLEELYVNDNPSLKTITTPLKNLLKVKRIRLNNNGIKSLTLSDSPNLTDLEIRNNKLEQLNIERLPKLKLLYLQNNMLSVEALDNIIKSLPNNQGNLSISGNPNPRGANLALAREKGWVLDVTPQANSEQIALSFPKGLSSSVSVSTLSGKVELVEEDGKKTIVEVGTSLTNPKIVQIPHGGKITLQGEILFLDASNHQVSSIDLSQATSIQLLNCSQNAIGTLNVSACKNLLFLYANECNLTKIEGLAHTKQLKELFVMNNQLTSLDLSQCNNLTALNIDRNSISHIQLDNLTALSALSCKKNKGLKELELKNHSKLVALSCEQNEISKLDFTGTPNIETLYCGDNKLNELNIATLRSLKELNCKLNQLKQLDLSNNIKLAELYCFDNELTELDLSAQHELNTLSCGANKLTKLILPKNNKITSLSVSFNKLQTLALEECNLLQQAALDHNAFTELQLASQQASLLIVHNNKITAEGCNKLIASLPNRSATTDKGVIVFYNKAEFGADPEENILSEGAQQQATEKGWQLFDGETPLSAKVIDSLASVMIYPTVTAWQLNIQGEVLFYYVINTRGEKLIQGTGNVVNVSALPEGTYWITLYTSSTSKKTIPFQITR